MTVASESQNGHHTIDRVPDIGFTAEEHRILGNSDRSKTNVNLSIVDSLIYIGLRVGAVLEEINRCLL